MSSVTVLKTSPATVLDDYKTLLDLSKCYKHIPNTQELLLKINLSWSLYYPACSTEPWQLEGVIKPLLEHKYALRPVENRTVVTKVWEGARGNKWLPILDKCGLPFEPLTEKEWVPFKPKGELLALNEVFPEEHKIPKMFLGKNVMHLPTMKTHGHTTMTGAMKNAFGGLINENRHHCHKKIHEVLVDLLTIQKEIHPHRFAVMDGTVCGDGDGPRTMIPRIKNFILASHDQVAIDAISAKMMGFDPMKIPFIKIAHDKGLGMGDPDQIDIVGENIKNVNFHFNTGRSLVVFFDQLLRRRSGKFVEKNLFHTKLFWLAIFGSSTYHDVVWYNLVGRPRIRKFMKTDWGKLFQRY